MDTRATVMVPCRPRAPEESRPARGPGSALALEFQVVQQVVLEIAVRVERAKAREDRLAPADLGGLAVNQEAGKGKGHKPAGAPADGRHALGQRQQEQWNQV